MRENSDIPTERSNLTLYNPPSGPRHPRGEHYIFGQP